ncbi:hypothetical protein PSACC_00459, partial [Paramicrosporidium saccamoebae]
MKIFLCLCATLGWLLFINAAISEEQDLQRRFGLLAISEPTTDGSLSWESLTAEAANAMISRHLGVPNWRSVALKADHLEKMLPVVNNLLDEHFNVMQEDVCPIFLEFLDLLAVKPMANKACRCTLYRTFSSSGANARMQRLIPAIPVAWAQEDAVELTKALASADMKKFHLLDYDALEALFKSEEACKFMNATLLLGPSPSLQRPIAAACLARMPGLDKVALTPSKVAQLGSDAFISLNIFPKLRLSHLSPCQITKFAGIMTVNDLKSLADSQILALGVNQWTTLGSGLINLSDRCLKFVTGDIAHAMKSHLRPNMVSKLAPDAFRLFSADDFKPFHLDNLRTDQLALLSAHVPLHSTALARFTSQEFKNRFEALNREHVEWSWENSRRNDLLQKLMSDVAIMRQKRTDQNITTVLNSCSSLAAAGWDSEKLNLHLIEVLNLIPAQLRSFEAKPLVSVSDQTLIKISLGTVDFAYETLLRPSPFSRFLQLRISLKDTFDSRIAMLTDFAGLLAIPKAVADGGREFVDTKAVMVAWISDTLKQFLDFTTMIPGTGQRKFVWCIDHKLGLPLGLLMGKALQHKLRLPFALGLE